jgi:colanic acid/amylovoran biosynthesis protein
MGPFDDPATARFAGEILEAANLVWVRDEQSYEHAVSLVGPRASIRRAPDITIGLRAEPPERPAADVVLVPNERLIDRGGRSRADYVRTLLAAGTAAQAEGRSVEVLVHTDEPGDAALAHSLASMLKCAVTSEVRGARVKGRLGTAQLVVASRFHALLGALSQGVPAIALGWSHKYAELFRDFDCSELAPSDDSTVPSLIHDALRDSRDVRERIGARLPALHQSVEEMWVASLPALGLGVPVAA